MVQIVTLIIIFLLVLMFAKKILAYKSINAVKIIVNDLKTKGAFDSESAIDLPYARQPMFKFGFKDYKPKILVQLIQNDFIGISEEGKYFLNESKYPALEQLIVAGFQSRGMEPAEAQLAGRATMIGLGVVDKGLAAQQRGQRKLGRSLKKTAKRELNTWQRYVKANSKRHKYKSGKKKGQVNFKSMSAAFKKTPAGRKRNPCPRPRQG